VWKLLLPRRRRFLWVAMSVVILVAGILTLRVTVHEDGLGPNSAASSPSPCRIAQLSLRLVDTGDAAGSVAWVGTFVNQSLGPCSLRRYPHLQMLGAGRVPIRTTVSDETAQVFGSGPGTVLQKIDLGHDEEASFTMTVSDGAQSLPSLPACAPAVALAVSPPGADRGIEAVSPGLIAYPYDKGGRCGFVGVGALIAGSAKRANCPACYPAPVLGAAAS
jgi:hypothetical protein